MISIIIPAYNEEKVIQNTLKSIKNSEYANYEIIIVANGCTDKTIESSKLADKIYELKEKGVAKARNYGAEKAKGEMLVFLDADTLLKKNTLGKIAKLKHPILGTSYGIPNNKKIRAWILIGMKNLTTWTGWSNGIIYCSKQIFQNIKFDEYMTKREDGAFLRTAKRKYQYKTTGTVINDMRRYDAKGYISVPLFWIKEKLKLNKKDYPTIR